MKRFLSFLLPLLGLILFVVIVLRTGVTEILDVFRDVSPARLAFVPVLMLIIIIVRGIRWRYIMRVMGIEYSLYRATTIWTIGFFASSVTPAKAGDALRAVYVQKDTGKTFGESLVTVFVDRLWDLLFVLVAGLVSITLFSRSYMAIPSTWLVVLGALGMFAAIVVVTRRNLMKRVLQPIFGLVVPERFRDNVTLNFNSFYDMLMVYNRGWKQHVGAMFLTVVCWALIFFFAYYTTRMLSIEIDAKFLMLMWPIVTLVELVPVSISGLGTRDAAVIYFFSLVGLGSSEAVGFSLAYLLLGTYLTGLTGFLFWLKNPIRLGGGES